MPTVLVLLLKYKYLFLFPAAALGGPIISLFVGFLVFSGVMKFWLSYVILLCGDILSDNFYYGLGYFGRETKFVKNFVLRRSSFVSHLDIIKKLFTDHGRKTMFFGKIAHAVAAPFIVSAGIIKLPYKRFLSYTMPVSFFQYAVLIGIGYYLGNSYNTATKYVDYAYLFITVSVVTVVVVYFLVIKYATKRIGSMEKEEE